MQLTAVLIPAQEGGFIAMNPETGTHTQGESVEEALVHLREAVELYLEEFPLAVSSLTIGKSKWGRWPVSSNRRGSPVKSSRRRSPKRSWE